MSAFEGIVVGWVDVGESDRIVRLLSPTEGRVSVSAPRLRAGRSPGLAELGARVRIELGKGKTGRPRLKSVERLSGPLRARDDVARIALLGYGAEVCASLAPEGAPAEKLHGLLGAWLDLLEAEEPPGPAARPALEAKALTFAGLAPALLVCARCGEALDDPAVFEPESGGGLHARCGTGVAVSASGLADLERLRRTPLAELSGAPAPRVPPWLLSGFVVWQLGRPLRSRALLEALG